MSSRSRTGAPVLRIASRPSRGGSSPRSAPNRARSQSSGSCGIHSAALLKDPRKSHPPPDPLAPQVLVRARKTSWKRSCADPVQPEIDGKSCGLADKLWCSRRRLRVGAAGRARRDAALAQQLPPPRWSGAETRERKTLRSDSKTEPKNLCATRAPSAGSPRRVGGFDCRGI